MGTKLKAGPSTDLKVLVAGVRAAGFPEPEPEFFFAKEIGRLWRFDLAWPDYKVGLERHGGTWAAGHHTQGKGFRDDREKMNQAQILGWIVVEATVDMLREGLALRQLLSALQLRRPQ